MYQTQVDVKSGGVAFYEGKTESDADLEARLWIEAILNDTPPVTTPEQACVVSEILEAIYTSARTGQAVNMG